MKKRHLLQQNLLNLTTMLAGTERSLNAQSS